MKTLSALIWDKYDRTLARCNNTADEIELARLKGKADALIWCYDQILKYSP